MLRTSVTVDGQMYRLAQGQDVDAIKTAAVEAARAGAGLVDFIVVGNRAVSVLVTPAIRVLFERTEVERDDRDTGDTHFPYTAADELDF
jgi:hypothetical protein